MSQNTDIKGLIRYSSRELTAEKDCIPYVWLVLSCATKDSAEIQKR